MNNELRQLIWDRAKKYYPEKASHGLNHIQDNLNKAEKMLEFFKEPFTDQIYAAIVFHDSGLEKYGREIHEVHSAEIAKRELKDLFSSKDLYLIAAAIKEHRASFKGEFTSMLSDICSSADRNSPNFEASIARSFLYTEEHHPEFSFEEKCETVTMHQKAKYGTKGYARFPIYFSRYYGKDLTEYRRKMDSLDADVVARIVGKDGKNASKLYDASLESMDSVKKIAFPTSEIETIKKRDKIITTRVSADYYKFLVSDLVETPWKVIYKVVKRQEITDVKKHPFYSELTKEQIDLLSKYNKIAVLTLEKRVRKFYRVTYSGVGIYQALFENSSEDDWEAFLDSDAAKWLPKPTCKYKSNYKSYFTELGYKTFMEKTNKFMEKVLYKNKIKVHEYINIDLSNVVYQDKYQVVVDQPSPTKYLLEPNTENQCPINLWRWSIESFSDEINPISLQKVRDNPSEEEMKLILEATNLAADASNDPRWTMNELRKYLKVKPNIFFIYKDGEPIGVVFLGIDRGYNEIGNFAIFKKYQGKGYGLQSLKVIIDYLRKIHPEQDITIGVAEKNTKAVNLYKKVGFKITEVGEEKTGKFYQMVLDSKTTVSVENYSESATEISGDYNQWIGEYMYHGSSSRFTTLEPQIRNNRTTSSTKSKIFFTPFKGLAGFFCIDQNDELLSVFGDRYNKETIKVLPKEMPAKDRDGNYDLSQFQHVNTNIAFIHNVKEFKTKFTKRFVGYIHFVDTGKLITSGLQEHVFHGMPEYWYYKSIRVDKIERVEITATFEYDQKFSSRVGNASIDSLSQESFNDNRQWVESDIKSVEDLKEFYKDCMYGIIDFKANRPWKETHENTYFKDWEENWRLLSVAQLLKFKCGVCYDTAKANDYFLTKFKVEHVNLFAMTKRDVESADYNDDPTHTFTVYKDEDGKWKWLEASWGTHKNNTLSESSSDKLVRKIGQLLSNASGQTNYIGVVQSFPPDGTNMADFYNAMKRYVVHPKWTINPDKSFAKEDFSQETLFDKVASNIENNKVYHASPLKLDILKGKASRTKDAESSVFVSPFKHFASMFILDFQGIVDTIEEQIGKKHIKIDNFGFMEWNETPRSTTSIPSKIHVLVRTPETFKPFKGKATGYMYTIDFSKYKDQANMWSKAKDSDVEFTIHGDVKPEKCEQISYEYEVLKDTKQYNHAEESMTNIAQEGMMLLSSTEEERKLTNLAKPLYEKIGRNSWEHIQQDVANGVEIVKGLYHRKLTLMEYAAVLFHDCSVKAHPEKVLHAKVSSEMAKPILQQCGYFTNEEVDQICEAIYEHDFDTNPDQKWTTDLSDFLASADFNPPNIAWVLNKVYIWGIRHGLSYEERFEEMMRHIPKVYGTKGLAVYPRMYSQYHKNKIRDMQKFFDKMTIEDAKEIVEDYRKRLHLQEDDETLPDPAIESFDVSKEPMSNTAQENFGVKDDTFVRDVILPAIKDDTLYHGSSQKISVIKPFQLKELRDKNVKTISLTPYARLASLFCVPFRSIRENSKGQVIFHHCRMKLDEWFEDMPEEEMYKAVQTVHISHNIKQLEPIDKIYSGYLHYVHAEDALVDAGANPINGKGPYEVVSYVKELKPYKVEAIKIRMIAKYSPSFAKECGLDADPCEPEDVATEDFSLEIPESVPVDLDIATEFLQEFNAGIEEFNRWVRDLDLLTVKKELNDPQVDMVFSQIAQENILIETVKTIFRKIGEFIAWFLKKLKDLWNYFFGKTQRAIRTFKAANDKITRHKNSNGFFNEGAFKAAKVPNGLVKASGIDGFIHSGFDPDEFNQIFTEMLDLWATNPQDLYEEIFVKFTSSPTMHKWKSIITFIPNNSGPNAVTGTNYTKSYYAANGSMYDAEYDKNSVFIILESVTNVVKAYEKNAKLISDKGNVQSEAARRALGYQDRTDITEHEAMQMAKDIQKLANFLQIVFSHYQEAFEFIIGQTNAVTGVYQKFMK